MVWQPPFELSLSESELYLLESYIPKTKSDIRLYNSEYHESKIATVRKVAPYLSRVEAWTISMYLGPTAYYTKINRALQGALTNEVDKFLLIAKAATVALVKIPPVTLAYVQSLPQPDNTQTTGLLRRYKGMSPRRMEPYQVGEIITEPTFVSTTYWHLPFGIIQRYAENANTVFEINITPNINGSVGRYVDPLKRRNREGEILFPPGVQFRVKERTVKDYPLTVDTVESNITIIEMEEV
ncbi:MAG: ADP-ribosyltransferase [Cyanobacteria bacterium J06635_10]